MICDKIADPIWLLLLLIIFFVFIIRKRPKFFIGFSSSDLVKSSKTNIHLSKIFGFLRKFLWILLFILLVLIIARPMLFVSNRYQEREVKKIALSIDTSASMQKWTLEKIKDIVNEFIDKRKGDYIAITAYGGDNSAGGEAGIIRSLTNSSFLAKDSVKSVKSEMFGFMTAIGEGIWVSTVALIKDEVNYLSETKGYDFNLKKLRIAMKSQDSVYLDYFSEILGKKDNRAIILFTDGKQTAGIDFFLPILLDKKLGIRLYIVAFGTFDDDNSRKLKKLVSETGGRLFEGTNYKDVKNFYREIDRLEKDKIFVKRTQKLEENYSIFALVALAVLAIFLAIEYIWIKIP